MSSYARSLHVRVCAVRLVLSLAAAPRCWVSAHVAALGPGFGCCVAAAAASLRLGLLGDVACRLVGAGLFAMGQIGTQVLPGPWFERRTQEPNLSNRD